jgi:hypothetical protein
MSARFPYDAAIVTALKQPVETILDVLEGLETIAGVCVDGDGLKWFNGLYLAVTQAVESRVNTGGFADAAWLAQLDVEFARFYFAAVRSALTGAPCPGCWRVLFGVRDNVQITRIQFALAGMNAHINHDLCLAVDATCKATHTPPQHGTAHYHDYTAVNATLEQLIAQAKQTLKVRLPGDCVPAVEHLEDLIAGWDISAAREKAWLNAEHLWNLPPVLAPGLMDVIDGFTGTIGKALLVPVP